MSRLQWFEIGRFDRKTLRQLANRLADLPYKPDARIGFQIDEVRSTHISGRIIERLAFVETIEDPFGGKLQIDRVQYETAEFTVFDEYPQLECRSGVKAIKTLRNEIAKALNFEISIEKIAFEIETLFKIMAAAGADVTVTRLSVNDVELSQSVFAQVTVAGSTGIKSALRDLVGKRRYQVTKARVSISCGNAATIYEATQAGVISTDHELGSESIDFFRNCLRRLRSRSNPDGDAT